MKNIMYTLLTLILLSCGPKVTTTKMSDKSLENYKTFAYLPNSNFDDLNKFEQDNTVGMNVIDLVNKKMMDKGYTLDRTNPDLLILLSTTVDKEKSVSQEPVYATYPTYYDRTYRVSPYYANNYYYDYYNYRDLVGYETEVDTYKEGMLMFRLVDSKTKNIIWQATASDYIFKQNNSNAMATFVDDMFAEFPIQK
ncbi:DUF4136 domain-containing protein [Psychroserpens sp. Hel_I_66]|uniref:DUF4136 domain-containing protein n=1 Tax=Psychroserpens sp. Hel_I_66 TaxID=1250004 RepID=UPI0006480BE8|nr:DUF4136 domain-containing protein [Psychroserpens sp. Hel_I_66]